MATNTIQKTLYFNGRSVGTPGAEWIYSEAGKIKKLGNGAPPIGLGKDVQSIDLQKGFVFPGFIDTHIHLHMLGQQKMELDLRRCLSLQELLDSVQRYHQANPNLSCLRGFGWDESKWPAPLLPTAVQLSQVCPDKALLLTKIDGHAGLANLKLLEKAAIVKGRTIASGWIGVDSEQNPNGHLKERALEVANAALPPYSPQELDEALALGQRQCIRSGITCIHESAATLDLLESFRRCDQKDTLRMLINAALYGDAIAPALEAGAQPADLFMQAGQRLRQYGIKFFLDGSLGSRSALLNQSYADDPGNSGLQMMSSDTLEQEIFQALGRGFQPLVHAIGPHACHLALKCFERALGQTQEPNRSLRCRIEHGEVLIPQDILLAAGLGVVFAVQPKHIVSDSSWLETRLGRTLAKCAGSWNSMTKAGIRLAGGSDAPLDELSPFMGILSASHRPEHYPEESLSREEAIRLYTDNAAFSAHQERVMGSLREGLLANFAILDRDIRICSRDKLLGSTVLQTIILGQVEHSVYF